jgi:catecholate siderophore receptor
MDVNRAVPSLGENVYARINMVSHRSEVAGRNSAENRRSGFAPSLAWGLGTSKRTYLSFFKLTSNDIPDYGIPFLFDKPASVNRTNYYGFKNGNYLNTDVNIATIRNENNFSESSTLNQQLRYATYKRAAMITEAKVPVSVAPGTPIETINVDRNQLAGDGTDTSFDYDINVTTKFDTSHVSHTLVAGAEFVKETTNPTRYRFTGVPQTSLLNPSDVPFTGTGSVNTKIDAVATTSAVYLMDTLKLSEKWEWTEQLRYDYVESKSEQSYPATVKISRYDSMLGSRGGLVFKPVPEGSIYLTYATSFNPSVEQLSLSSANANVDPEKNRVYELGTKWNFFDGDLNFTSALFQTEKENARTPDPNDPTVNVLEGNQKVHGFEVEASGNLTKKWQIFAGYTYADSEITASNTPADVGSRLANAPLNTASLWTTYEVNSKWQAGFGAKAVSSRIASLTPDAASGLIKTVDGYSVYDAMVKYQFSKDIGFQLNLYNLDDKFYIDGVQGSHSVPGAGRSLLLTTNFNL